MATESLEFEQFFIQSEFSILFSLSSQVKILLLSTRLEQDSTTKNLESMTECGEFSDFEVFASFLRLASEGRRNGCSLFYKIKIKQLGAKLSLSLSVKIKDRANRLL